MIELNLALVFPALGHPLILGLLKQTGKPSNFFVHLNFADLILQA